MSHTGNMLVSTTLLLAIVMIPLVKSIPDLESTNDDSLQETEILLGIEDVADNRKHKKVFLEEKFEKEDVDCLVWNRKCSVQLLKIKETILKAFDNDCTDCREEEKQLAGNAMATLLFKQPEVWKLFIKRYDTNNSYGKLFLS
ncbi:allergen Tha p 1-like [Arctopsyche grandis]|uniref:allergen Tha p 1-like n=1 Tax=Arctopsyche grandis TaxID=121162 RepID=UPI00406D8AEC